MSITQQGRAQMHPRECPRLALVLAAASRPVLGESSPLTGTCNASDESASSTCVNAVQSPAIGVATATAELRRWTTLSSNDSIQ